LIFQAGEKAARNADFFNSLLGQDIVRERFSVERMVDSNLALYQKILASHHS
jgi:hypothetical protein